MDNRKGSLLKSLLIALVREWGHAHVMAALVGLKDSAETTNVKPRSDKKKSSPVEILERTEIPADKRELLLELTKRFMEKNFLPALNDVKIFLEIKGVETLTLKHRSDAYKKVLASLLDESVEQLKELVDSRSYSGPSRLGPLSDAIRESGALLRPEPDLTNALRSEERVKDSSESDFVSPNKNSS